MKKWKKITTVVLIFLSVMLLSLGIGIDLGMKFSKEETNTKEVLKTEENVEDLESSKKIDADGNDTESNAVAVVSIIGVIFLAAAMVILVLSKEEL